MGYLEGFYYNPRIDKKLLREHSRGADRAVGLPGRRDRADAHAPRARGGGGRGARVRGHLRHGATSSSSCSPTASPEQEQVNGHLIELSKKTGIPLVATNDCHYLNRHDARAHEILMCVQQKKHDQGREAAAAPHRRVTTSRRPPRWTPTSSTSRRRSRTRPRIGELCNVELKLGKTFLPKFKVPDGMTADIVPGHDRAPRGCAGGFDEASPARARRFDGDVVRGAAGARAGRHPEDGLLRLLPHRLGLHQLRQGARHPGGPGARLGRRLAGRVRAAHHRHRSDRRTSCCSSAS